MRVSLKNVFGPSYGHSNFEYLGVVEFKEKRDDFCTKTPMLPCDVSVFTEYFCGHFPTV